MGNQNLEIPFILTDGYFRTYLCPECRNLLKITEKEFKCDVCGLRLDR